MNKSDIMSTLLIVAAVVASFSNELISVPLFFIGAAIYNLAGESK